MRGYPYPNELKEKTINLRKRGYSLNEISSQIKIPKTTIHDWVANKIILSERAKTRIKKRIFAGILKANRKKRIKITKPIKWSRGLIRIVSSFLFDGYSKIRGCAYCSRNLSQINLLRKIIYKIFKLTPYFYITKKGILKIEYNSIEFKKYINKKKKELLNYILSAPNEEKRIFLQTFFDDEGCINFNKNSKRVRGYQHSKKILKLVNNLLKDFQIDSYIDKNNTEITISNKDNLKRFQKEINFSPNIFINPNRKNAIRKFKIDKRTILEKAINSYQN